MQPKTRLLLSVFALTVLCGCQPTATNNVNQKAAELMFPIKGENIGDNITPLKGSRTCQFSHRMVCAGGRACDPIKTDIDVYTMIDFDNKTYSRCTSVDGCVVNSIDEIGTGNPINNISIGKVGVLVKFGPGSRFVDVATQGAMIYIADGVCKRT